MTRQPSQFEISFVIPCYNAALVIDQCIESIKKAIQEANIKKWEIVLVNDGSTDTTIKRLQKFNDKIHIKIIDLKKNQGRFLARKAGIESAQYDQIILIDTKVLLHKNALKFLTRQLANHPNRKVWNAHVESDANTNTIAAFNEASVMLVWGRYLRNPRLVSFGIEEFDFYPKGTTCILLPKGLLQKALAQFRNISYMKYVSDDTRLLRSIAAETKIWISPKFSCYYRARNSLSQFIPWAYNRGILFIDSYLYKSTRFFGLTILALFLPFIFLAFLIVWPPLGLVPIAVWVVALIYLRFRLSKIYLLAIAKLSWIYFFAFMCGLYKGVYLRSKGSRS